MDEFESIMISVRSMSDEARLLLQSCGTNGQIAFAKAGSDSNNTHKAIDELISGGLVNEIDGKYFLSMKGNKYMQAAMEHYRDEHIRHKYDDFVKV